ncbi:MAG: WS/DGAT domain-containing protein [Actinomycetota bacterium]|nr:WS/DGAT domain-containing protein [Actinomycetota bacterium]
MRAAITVVTLLDSSPGIDHLRARVEVLTAHLPRLAQRIETGAVAFSKPRWVPDGDFDPAWHVRVVRAPSAAGLAGVLRLVEPLATDGFDRARPPWQMLLVEDVDGVGGAALIIRLHHVCADGVGALRLATVLFDLAPGAVPLPPPSSTAEDPERTGGVAPGPVGDALRSSLTIARHRLPALVASAREAFADPQPRAQATVDLVRSVARLASPSLPALSPVMTGRSLASYLGAIDLDLDRARAAGRDAGGTINDVFVAGLLEGLRRYHGAHGHQPETLRIGVPINLRTDDTDASVTNAFAPARITAPLQILDPSARIAAVHRLVLSERHQPAHDIIGALAGLVRRLPAARAAMGSALGSLDAMASNVPGPPVPLWLGPARVTGLYPYGPRSGSGLNVTLLSQEGTARIGVHADPAATPDGDVLVDCLRAGWAATLR